MRKIKVLSILIVLALTVSLAACAGSDTSGTTTGGTQTTTGGSNGEIVNLTFMGWEASPLETESVRQGIASFESQFNNIKVEYTPGLAGSEYSAKLLAMFAGNAAPDIFFCGDSDYRVFAARDVLLNITEKFDSTFPLDDFIESSQTIMNIDGQVYGISSCTVSPIIYYNKSMFDDADLPYPSSDPAEAMTWDEYRALAKQLTVKDGDRVVQYGTYGLESWLITPIIYSNGGRYFDDDFTKATVNDPRIAEVLTAVRDLRVVDGSAPDATTLENVGMNAAQMLQTGRVAMLIDGSWALQQLSQMDFEIGMAPLPKFEVAQTTGGAHLHAIWANTPNEDEAWEFLKFLSGYDYQGALVSAGLWMPNRKSMYEPAGVEQWFVEEVHGEDFKKLIPYFLEARVIPSALYPSSMLGTIIDEERDMFFKDGVDIDTTLQNMETRLNAELARISD